MLRAIFCGGAGGEQLLFADAVGGQDGSGLQFAVGDGSGLIKDDGVDRGSCFNDVAAAVEDA